MKKEYSNPEMKVVEVEAACILAGSIGDKIDENPISGDITPGDPKE